MVRATPKNIFSPNVCHCLCSFYDWWTDFMNIIITSAFNSVSRGNTLSDRSYSITYVDSLLTLNTDIEFQTGKYNRTFDITFPVHFDPSFSLVWPLVIEWLWREETYPHPLNSREACWDEQQKRFNSWCSIPIEHDSGVAEVSLSSVKVGCFLLNLKPLGRYSICSEWLWWSDRNLMGVSNCYFGTGSTEKRHLWRNLHCN